MKLLCVQGDYSGVEGYCNDILKLYPDSVDIHFWRIVVLYKQGYIDFVEEIFNHKNSDQSCTATETEKELFLYKLKERDSAISEIKRVGKYYSHRKNDKQIVLRGDNLLTRKQASKIIFKSIKAQESNEENISAYILMPYIIGKGKCHDNPCFFLEKLRNAYQSNFEIENPDNVEEWIMKEENVLFWEIWGKE